MIHNTTLCLVSALALSAGAYSQQPVVQGMREPVTAPLHSIHGTLDLRTGTFVRERTPAIGVSGRGEVYDNTCATGGYIGLGPPTIFTGGNPPAVGDHGAIPSDAFAGDSNCTAGCAPSYDITQFEIAWCQFDAPPTGSVIELNFWDGPLFVCAPNPTGGTRPPTVPTVLSGTLAGLPRNNMSGVLACYVLTVTLTTPGFTLSGSPSFTPGAVLNPTFSWSFAMPTSTGLDGPILSGDLSLGTPCAPCAGTIFEVGGGTTNQGTGAGQSSAFWLETYGGGPPPACLSFGASSPTGFHLELFADKPCIADFPFGVFCDAGDNSLQSCPCAPGAANTGCANPIPPMQGGGVGNGILLQPVAQVSSPSNRATFNSLGFPAGSTPGGVVFRNIGLDPSAPVVFGDGLRCVDALSSPGTLVRIGASAASGGSMTNVVGHGAMAGSGTFYYQLWYRSTPASYCDPTAAFNLSNGVSLTW